MVVEPPDPLEGGELDVLQRAPCPPLQDDFRLEEADDRFAQGVDDEPFLPPLLNVFVEVARQNQEGASVTISWHHSHLNAEQSKSPSTATD
jgi:hypothetical protein